MRNFVLVRRRALVPKAEQNARRAERAFRGNAIIQCADRSLWVALLLRNNLDQGAESERIEHLLRREIGYRFEMAFEGNAFGLKLTRVASCTLKRAKVIHGNNHRYLVPARTRKLREITRQHGINVAAWARCWRDLEELFLTNRYRCQVASGIVADSPVRPAKMAGRKPGV